MKCYVLCYERSKSPENNLLFVVMSQAISDSVAMMVATVVFGARQFHIY